jgi:hypothetical protein
LEGVLLGVRRRAILQRKHPATFLVEEEAYFTDDEHGRELEVELEYLSLVEMSRPGAIGAYDDEGNSRASTTTTGSRTSTTGTDRSTEPCWAPIPWQAHPISDGVAVATMDLFRGNEALTEVSRSNVRDSTALHPPLTPDPIVLLWPALKSAATSRQVTARDTPIHWLQFRSIRIDPHNQLSKATIPCKSVRQLDTDIARG